MASLPSWLARVFGRKQAEIVVAAAVADDGSGADPVPGELSPFRADPATGGLLTKNVDAQPMAVGPGVAPIGQTAQSVYVIQAGSGAPVLDEIDGSERLGVVLMGGFARANQGAGDRGQKWFVASSPDGSLVQQVAIADKQDIGNTTLASLLDRKLAERLTGHGEQRTAARHEIFQFTAGTIEDTEILGFSGTGTHGIDAARRAQYIAVDGVSGRSQALQSNTNYPFPPSVPFAVYGVVQFSDAGVVGQVRRVQVGADDDYLGLRFDGTDISIEILSALSGVPVSIPRSSWLDPIDGTGASAYAIDWTAPNTIELVSGAPGANAGFAAINGIKILDLPAYMNVAGVMKRSMKPVRAIVYNTAAASPGTIYVRGFSIHALGNYRLPVRVRSAPATPVTRSMSTVLSPLIAVRVKGTLGGEAYRGFCYPKQLTITNKSSSAVLDVILYRNPTSLTGASWADVSPRSGIQVDTSATAADLTGATALYVDVVQTSSAKTIDLTAVFEEHLSNLIRNRVDGTSDVVVVMCATSISNSDVRAGFVLDEVPG